MHSLSDVPVLSLPTQEETELVFTPKLCSSLKMWCLDLLVLKKRAQVKAVLNDDE